MKYIVFLTAKGQKNWLTIKALCSVKIGSGFQKTPLCYQMSFGVAGRLVTDVCGVWLGSLSTSRKCG